MSRSTADKPGFTIVELMLALAFFSFILMFVLGGFLLITRNYNQGVTSSRIHQAGRNVLERMVRDLRQSNTDPVYVRAVGGRQAFICFSGGTYRAWDKATVDSNYGQFRFTPQDMSLECAAAADGDAVSLKNLPNTFSTSSDINTIFDEDEVVITALNLEPLGSSNSIFRLDISLASENITDAELGVDDSDDGFNDGCSVATSGREFCDVVTLSTTFTTR